MQPWEFVHSESTNDYGIFKARVDHLRSPRTQDTLRRVILETPDWVNVVARTEKGGFLMVRQIRHGIAAPCLEIPAGMMEEGETPEQAASRELLEETGYLAETIRPLGQVFPNPAFQNNTCYLLLADNCKKVAEPSQDSGEDIQVEEWNWEDVLQATRDGRIAHALCIAALYYYRDSLGSF